jgi:hypothetical protein
MKRLFLFFRNLSPDVVPLLSLSGTQDFGDDVSKVTVKVKVKLSLTLTKHCAMGGEWRYSPTDS